MSPSNGSSVFTLVETPEPGPRRTGESVWGWLERSNEPVAVAARAQWEEWLSQLPPSVRDAFVRRLKDHSAEQVRAALAELVMFKLLDSVYPSVEVGPETASGSRTDFAVDVPVRTHFEIKRLGPAEDMVANARRLNDIAAELEKIESPDFWLEVDVQSGPQVPSMRTVRQQAEKWLACLDYETEVRRRDDDAEAPQVFERSGAGWSVRIRAHPRAPDKRGPGQFTVGLRSGVWAHLVSFDGLQAAVRGKLSEHAGLADPLVVVLDLSSTTTGNREIAEMLYGRTTTLGTLDLDTPGAMVRDRPEGIWPDPVPRPPRPAAVVILRGIWLAARAATAELWLPPGFESPLIPGPWSLWTLGPDDQAISLDPADSARNG